MDLHNIDHEDGDLRACVRALSADARRTLEDHPSTDELVRYHERALGSEEAEGVRDHLALCPECARRGLDLAGFLEPGIGDEELSAADGPPDWAATRRTLVREGLLEEPRPALARLRPPRLAYAMAALFFVTSVGFALWLATVHRTLGELSQARAVQVVDLFADSATQRGQSLVPPASAAGSGDLALILNELVDPEAYPDYRVEITDPDDRVIQSIDHLELNPDGTLTVLVPRRRLPDERYLVRLYGSDGPRKVPLADFPLRFQPQPP